MKQKLKSVLLIDDDDSINFVHEMFIRKADFTENIVSVKSGKQALNYLQTESEEAHTFPNLIFLDINMPAMNGWEFLEKYKDLDQRLTEKTVIVMLTSSSNAKDEAKAHEIPQVNEYRNKPISIAMIDEILQNHFPTVN